MNALDDNYERVRARQVRPVVSVHQPNFLPWLGYFHKIATADSFIFYDDVKFSKGSFTNRTRILVGGKKYWLTVPIHFKSSSKISEVELAATDWRSKHLRIIQSEYSRAPYFRQVFPVLEEIYATKEVTLSGFNIVAVKNVCEYLGLPAVFLTSSDLSAFGVGENRLASLVEIVGGKTYLSGTGAKSYQTGRPFAEKGIKLLYSDFSESPFPQGSDSFLPGMSVLMAILYLSPHEIVSFLTKS